MAGGNGRIAPTRSPRRIVIIGAGPGAIVAGYRLTEAGFTDFVMLEQAGPGRRAPGPATGTRVWPATWSPRAYQFSFAAQARLVGVPTPTNPRSSSTWSSASTTSVCGPTSVSSTAVRGATWDDAAATWTVTHRRRRGARSPTSSIASPGMFGAAVLPDIEGRESFAGTVVHTVRLARRPRPHRRAGGGDRQRGQRGAARARGGEGGRRGSTSSSARPTGCCPRRTRRSRPSRSPRFADDPRRPRRGAGRGASSRSAPASPSPMEDGRGVLMEQAGLANIAVVDDPDAAGEAHADRRRGAASARSSRTTTTRRSTCPHVELVTDPIVAHHAHRRRHRRRHRARGRRRSSTPPATRRPRYISALDDHRPRRPRHRRRLGRRRPRVPRRHHRRVPEPVHALRAQHQPRLDHHHDRVPGRVRGADARPDGPRRAWPGSTCGPRR